MSAKAIVACRFVEADPQMHLSEKLQLKYPDPYTYGLAVMYALEAEEAGMSEEDIETYVTLMLT